MDIAQVVLNARLFNFKAGAVMEDSLLQAVHALFDALDVQRIEYVLVGGIAMLYYIEGRNTEDIDLIISTVDAKRLEGFTAVGEEQDFIRGTFQNLRIDFLLTTNKLFNYVKQQCSTKVEFKGRYIRCASVEGLLLLKLYALPSLYRQGKFDRVALYEGDVSMLLQKYHVDVEALFDELRKHLLDSDRRALREIYNDIENRIRRFKHGLGNNGIVE
jgi:hypothetical protein